MLAISLFPTGHVEVTTDPIYLKAFEADLLLRYFKPKDVHRPAFWAKHKLAYSDRL